MNEIKLKYTLNKRFTDEKIGWYRWDLKNGSKIVASVWLTTKHIKAEAFCFMKQAQEGQNLEDFKEEIKEYFENYLKG